MYLKPAKSDHYLFIINSWCFILDNSFDIQPLSKKILLSIKNMYTFLGTQDAEMKNKSFLCSPFNQIMGLINHFLAPYLKANSPLLMYNYHQWNSKSPCSQKFGETLRILQIFQFLTLHFDPSPCIMYKLPFRVSYQLTMFLLLTILLALWSWHKRCGVKTREPSWIE